MGYKHTTNHSNSRLTISSFLTFSAYIFLKSISLKYQCIFSLYKVTNLTIMDITPGIATTFKFLGKKHISGILFLEGEKVWFKESSSSIMVTMNPNWSTEIIWYETDYAKGKILSPLKCST